MTPWEIITSNFQFPTKIRGNPFVPMPRQIESINKLAPLPNQGQWHDMGTGKTFIATAIALYWIVMERLPIVVIMPPVLVTQWARWLALITPTLRVCAYKGTPDERKEMSLDADFVLVGVQIFKKDIARFTAKFGGRRFVLIVDEATIIANVRSAQHEMVYDFAIGAIQIPMTGTPADPPPNSYGLMKFSAPGVYKSLKWWENDHAVFDTVRKDEVVEWKDLDVLNKNLLINADRILRSDIYDKHQKPQVVEVPYDLDPVHWKLYKKLAEEQLLLLPNGGKIDGTTANRLRHALGQIIMNWGHFSGNPKHRSSAYDLIDQKMEGLAGGKLVVFAHYRMTVANLVQHYGKKFNAVQINSEVTPRQKDRAKELFIESDKCRLIVIQYRSGGLGLDGLQWVCNHAIMLEPPQQPYLIHQAICRLDRGGQNHRVMIDIAVAQKTLQVRGFKKLLDNDDTVNEIVRNAFELRKELYGE